MKSKQNYVIKYTLLIFMIGSIVSTTISCKKSKSSALPAGETWIKHVKEDLMPFWMSKVALGNPVGNFPTFRCDNGEAVNKDKPCNELLQAGSWISNNLNRNYVRMNSRQIYAYCAAYHLTGEEKYLEAAKEGVNYLRKYALDKKTGAAVSFFENGKPGLKPGQRTTQDLAYAQAGMAFYYYLTRDKDVLKDILKLKKYIFDNYYNNDWNMLMWVKQDVEKNKKHQKELVAQLDQVNAYMLMLAPILPEPYKTEWDNDLIKIVNLLLDKFYDKQGKRFWGYIHDESGKKIGARHSDYGHTIKSFWMIYLVGKYTENQKLISFSQENMPFVFKKAYREYSEDISFWITDSKWQGPSWWVYAELDQAAATLALVDDSFTKYLSRTYDYWLKFMVDKKNYEVWPWIGRGGKPGSPKAHLWKNGYHSLEHALVAYITTQALNKLPVKLYYAFKESKNEKMNPYYYTGKIANKKINEFSRLKELKKVSVVFDNVK